MAEPLGKAERLEWFKQHCRLREPSWAATFSHMDRQERREYRQRLLDPDYSMENFGKYAEEFRRRFLIALESLDLIDDSPPDKAARRAAAAVLDRVSRA